MPGAGERWHSIVRQSCHRMRYVRDRPLDSGGGHRMGAAGTPTPVVGVNDRQTQQRGHGTVEVAKLESAFRVLMGTLSERGDVV